MAGSRPAKTPRSVMMLVLLVAFAAVVPLHHAWGQTVINVPGDAPTIQAAIDAAAPGDMVLVVPGTYFENINFRGKAITVESSQGPDVTILDGSSAGSVVTFSSGEGLASVLRGFTVQRGNSSSDGGGVRIVSSSPTIQGNAITNNRACGGGGGIDADFSSARIEGNVITNNGQSASCSGGVGGGGVGIGGAGQVQLINNVIADNSWSSFSGGGITLWAAGSPTIRGNVIRNNSAYNQGGGMWIINQSDASIVQNLIVGNRAQRGGGIYWLVPSGARGPLLVNNTIADNDGEGSGIFASGFDAQSKLYNNIVVGSPGQPAVVCDQFYDPTPPILIANDVFSPAAVPYGGTCGDLTGTNGNQSADPLFVDPVAVDYHLTSTSPAIDAGDTSAPELPAMDFDGDPRVVGPAIDQGVDEFTIRVPSEPTDLTATRSRKTAIVRWSPPLSDGGTTILSYTVTVSDGRSVIVDASVTSVTFEDIRKKETYTFTVVATNAVGSGRPASVTLPPG